MKSKKSAGHRFHHLHTVVILDRNTDFISTVSATNLGDGKLTN